MRERGQDLARRCAVVHEACLAIMEDSHRLHPAPFFGRIADQTLAEIGPDPLK